MACYVTNATLVIPRFSSVGGGKLLPGFLFMQGESDGLEGGETVFPCVQPVGRSEDAIDVELCARLRRGFELGDRFLMPPEPGGMQRRSFDVRAAIAADEACAASKPTGLRITPKRGAAVLFLNAAASDDGSAAQLWQQWHGGCRVRAGVKWTMQQFKETPVR